jgi:hypothetical protein
MKKKVLLPVNLYVILSFIVQALGAGLAVIATLFLMKRVNATENLTLIGGIAFVTGVWVTRYLFIFSVAAKCCNCSSITSRIREGTRFVFECKKCGQKNRTSFFGA